MVKPLINEEEEERMGTSWTVGVRVGVTAGVGAGDGEGEGEGEDTTVTEDQHHDLVGLGLCLY